MSRYRPSHKSQKGFTLVEVMVAVSIFAIVTTIGIGSLLSINNAHRRSRLQRTGIDSLNFVLDSMARDIRTGSQYDCNPRTRGVRGDCYNLTGSTSFSFVDQDGRDVSFILESDAIKRTTDNRVEYLTSPEAMKVTDLRFRMKGTSQDGQDPYQPFVVMSIVGETESTRGELMSVALQTAVTQRLLDVPTGS